MSLSSIGVGGVGGGSITVKEVDGAPSVTTSTLRVPNTYLTDDGGGQATLAFPASSALTVKEVDGAPSVSATTLRMPNGTLTDDGGGQVTYTAAAQTVTVKEVDGSPSVAATTVRFPNGTLTDDGGGQVTYTPTASGSLTVKEIDTSPSVSSVTTIRVSNEFLTDDGSGQVTLRINNDYPPFTSGSNDDQFDNASFSGWTAVNTGTQVPTVTETLGVASVLHPGGGTSQYLWAYMKTYSPSANDYIECAFRFSGMNQNFNRAGLIMADGNTFGAGAQVIWCPSFAQNFMVMTRYTNYNTDAAGTTVANSFAVCGGGIIFLRLKYEGSNNWRGYTSPDGISWCDITGSLSFTLTPTHIGFFLTPYAGSKALCMSMLYFKQSA